QYTQRGVDLERFELKAGDHSKLDQRPLEFIEAGHAGGLGSGRPLRLTRTRYHILCERIFTTLGTIAERAGEFAPGGRFVGLPGVDWALIRSIVSRHAIPLLGTTSGSRISRPIPARLRSSRIELGDIDYRLQRAIKR